MEERFVQLVQRFSFDFEKLVHYMFNFASSKKDKKQQLSMAFSQPVTKDLQNCSYPFTIWWNQTLLAVYRISFPQ